MMHGPINIRAKDVYVDGLYFIVQFIVFKLRGDYEIILRQLSNFQHIQKDFIPYSKDS